MAVAAFFLHINYMPLSADEPIRAIIAFNMDHSGEYIVPYLNGELYLNKPPLYNWVLLCFFKIFGSYEEWVVRMPAVLSILVFGIYLYRVIARESGNFQLAFIGSMAFLTSGNLLFYSSYLGHIDVTYSLVTFAGFVTVYRGVKKEQWLKMFMISYTLCWVGFMMKGLPSLLFLALSIGPWLIIRKQWKKLFSIEHFTGLATFITLLSVYLVLYAQKAPLGPFIEQLWSESSQRTVAEKSFLESISHLFVFPVKLALDMAPYGLLLLLLLYRPYRKALFLSEWNRFAGVILAFNIVIYWLSPDYRARYVFMLMPLALVVLLTPFVTTDLFRKWTKIAGSVTGFTLWLIVIYCLYLSFADAHLGAMLVVGLSVIWILTRKFYPSHPFIFWKELIALLFIARIAYTYTVIPERVSKSDYLTEKHQGEYIARITQGEKLAMYHSNVNLTMNWYISTARNEPLNTKLDNDSFYFDEFYLVPANVLTDTSNYKTYFTFVRRYLRQPFELVKFHKYFPPMPKANAQDIPGNSSDE